MHRGYVAVFCLRLGRQERPYFRYKEDLGARDLALGDRVELRPDADAHVANCYDQERMSERVNRAGKPGRPSSGPGCLEPAPTRRPMAKFRLVQN